LGWLGGVLERKRGGLKKGGKGEDGVKRGDSFGEEKADRVRRQRSTGVARGTEAEERHAGGKNAGRVRWGEKKTSKKRERGDERVVGRE